MRYAIPYGRQADQPSASLDMRDNEIDEGAYPRCEMRVPGIDGVDMLDIFGVEVLKHWNKHARIDIRLHMKSPDTRKPDAGKA
jgi:hypothetical protein